MKRKLQWSSSPKGESVLPHDTILVATSNPQTFSRKACCSSSSTVLHVANMHIVVSNSLIVIIVPS